MVMNPKVSVIIPTYNCAQYIPEAIESVINQTYKNFEIIVVDDGSKDKTREILKPYIETNIIKYIFQENKGPSSARNTGIRAACGKYTAFLDADDLWHREMIEKTLRALERTGFDWAVTDWCRIIRDEKGRDISRRIYRLKHLAENPEGFDKIAFGIFAEKDILGIPFGSVVCRKECFQIAGPFDERLTWGEDHDMWIRFARHGLSLAYVEGVYFYYIYHGPTCITRSSIISNLDCELLLIKKHKKEAFRMDNKYRELYSNELWNMARKYIYGFRHYKKGLKCMILSQLYFPNPGAFFKSVLGFIRTKFEMTHAARHYFCL